MTNNLTSEQALTLLKNLAGEQVLILPKKPDTETLGGIIIPISSQRNQPQGEVVAIGHLYNGDLPDIKIGDTVLYPPEVGLVIEINGVKYQRVRYHDIMGKL